MIELAAKLGGFWIAHGILSISDNDEPLITLMGLEFSDGTQKMHRFVAPRIEQSIQEGEKMLDNNPDKAVRAALVYDGYVFLPGRRKVDALLVKIRDYNASFKPLLIGVPYRPFNSKQGFAVYRPKFLHFSGSDQRLKELGIAFYQGVYSHQQAASVWDQYLDESL